ncbi:MAG: NAD(P)H-hydrate epimerase [Pseudomonadales bacterium]|jgi:NAD(P)H-hydrate epimerase|nr:NAD(P)H-hydrate epimerase [Pseudomonadales bacterium]
MNAERYYTTAQVRELDRLASAEFGLCGFTLMQRAGAAALAALRQTWPEALSLHIFCGTGNNGGDGFIIGALALSAGLRAHIHIVGDAGRIRGDALQALQVARANGVPIDSSITFDTNAGTVAVDALLGTGLTGEVRSPYRTAIDAINASGLPVLAVDLPSGLDSDTGEIRGHCVNADLTVTFIGRKHGLVRGEGPRQCGELVFAALDVPATLYQRLAL